MIEFTVLKTKFEISPLFFSVLTAFLLMDKSGVAKAAVLFSILHEVGHFLALLCVKTMPQKVVLSLFGIEIKLLGNLSTAGKCLVFAAGFSVNFILSAMFFAFEKPLFAYINLAIGIFTALPLSATDGGTILKTLFEEYFQKKGERIFKIVSLCFLVAVSVIFIFAAYLTKNWFLLIALVYMVLCAIK